MKVIVPQSVDVKRLVAGLGLSPTRSVNLKSKIYYFLSRIVSTNDNYKLNEKNNGYRNICSTDMKKVLGNRDYSIILKLLSDSNDPVIQTNRSWYNPSAAGRCGFCKGYRLTEKYNTADVIFKTLPSKLGNRVIKNLKGEQDAAAINKKFHFLRDQFEKHQLTIDSGVYDLITSIGNLLLSRVKDNNVYQVNLILNTIGRWLYFIKKIENKEFWATVSPHNHRLHSNLTSLPGILRPFILCNGKRLIMIDVSSSQPYILSSVMRTEFFYGAGIGFNLRSIYPELYDELITNGIISNTSSSAMNFNTSYTSTYTGSTIQNQTYPSSTKASMSIYSSLSLSCDSSPFMWCQFFSISELEDIRRYQQSPFDQDFYIQILQSYYQNTNYTGEIDFVQQREKVKDTMMYVLFDDNKDHRNHNPYIQIFKTVYPGVERWINETHNIIGKEKFAYLMQRAESYLLLDIVSRDFNQKFPEIPIYTVHDALFTYEEYIPELKRLLLEGLCDKTGIRPGFKIKTQPVNPELQKDVVDEIWAEIGKVNSKKKYEKVSSGVFSSNIERGLDFLKSNEKSQIS